MSVQSTHLEHKEALPNFSIFSCGYLLLVHRNTATRADAKEDIDQLVQSSSDTMSSDKAGFNEANRMNGGIDSLKAKIAELELYNQGRVIPLILSTQSSNSRSETKLLMSYKFKIMNLVTDFPLIVTYQVDTFFAVRSPLGVFLALRNICIGICNPQYTCMIEILMSEYFTVGT
ncbi:hypothetical protein Pint_10600 [Pistacia integerrima]|uniref:Uncharacterized protein n=1 Tax=Pistacia integerrima TaxID=434235 RepID=A0ACC0XKT2_9ROSI|nr:hypothetical protein Pint_10600 [Pistacia integerrima]